MLLSAFALAFDDSPPPEHFVRYSVSMGTGIDVRPDGDTLDLSVPMASLRLYGDAGWGIEERLRLGFGSDAESRFLFRLSAVWAAAPAARVVPLFRVGVHSNLVPTSEAEPDLRIGPSVGFGTELWLLPRVAVDVGLDADVGWTVGAAGGPTPTLSASVTLRFGGMRTHPAGSLF